MNTFFCACKAQYKLEIPCYIWNMDRFHQIDGVFWHAAETQPFLESNTNNNQPATTITNSKIESIEIILKDCHSYQDFLKEGKDVTFSQMIVVWPSNQTHFTKGSFEKQFYYAYLTCLFFKNSFISPTVTSKWNCFVYLSINHQF